jgi:hypothetical protein
MSPLSQLEIDVVSGGTAFRQAGIVVPTRIWIVVDRVSLTPPQFDDPRPRNAPV